MRKFVEILKTDDRLIAAKCLKYSFVNNQIWTRSCLRKVISDVAVWHLQ